MIREDLSDVDILRGVHEKRPPEDKEEHEKHSSAESGKVVGSQILCGEGAEEDERDDAAHGAGEEIRSSSKAVDGESSPAVSDHGEAVPAGVEEERDRAGEA